MYAMETMNRFNSTRRKPPRGFTLVEILIAVVIFAIVMTTVLGSFRLAFVGIDDIKNGMNRFDAARSCLQRMQIDLQALQLTMKPRYRPPERDSDPDPFRIVGDTTDSAGKTFGRLRFASLAHVPLGRLKWDGVAEIVYYVEADRNDKPVLRRADRLDPVAEERDEASDPILCDQVLGLTFTYFDAEGTDYERWDSESDNFGYATPAAIEIKLTLGTEEDSDTFTTTVRLTQQRAETETT
jgi:general secretion pathway protein J